MPVYKITDNQTGKTLTVRGEGGPPTEEEAAALFASQAGQGAPEPPPRTGVMGTLDTVFQPIGRAIRNHPAAAGATIASMAAAPITGGMSLLPAMGAMGLAGAGGAGAGLATSQVANRDTAPLPTVSGNVQQMLAQGGAAAAGEGIGRGLAAAGQAGARRLMTSAVKGPVQDAPKVVQTLLDEGVNVTQGGIKKLQNILGEANAQIGAMVADAPGAVSPLQVAGRLNATAGKFANQVNPQADLEAISQVGQNFLDHPNIGAAMSVPQAQSMKVGTYQRLAGKYGELSNATVEGQKALARGLKEDIATQVPGVASLNAREGGILGALEPLAQRVGIQARSNPIGFAAVAMHNPTAFLVAMVDKYPAAKSMLANGMWAAAGRATGIPSNIIRGAIQAVAAGTADATSGTSSGPAGQTP